MRPLRRRIIRDYMDDSLWPVMRHPCEAHTFYGTGSAVDRYWTGKRYRARIVTAKSKVGWR